MKNKEPIEDELITREQLGEELSASQVWIRDHVSGRRKPVLPHVWLGERRGLLRFWRSQIKAFLSLRSERLAC